MIRECTLDDLDFLVETATEFNNRYFDVPLNPDKTRAYMESLISNPDGLAMRTECGAIVGVFVEDPMRDSTALVEIGWYSTDGTGAWLLKAFKRAAEERGVDELRMCLLSTSGPFAETLLQTFGGEVVETSYRIKTKRG